jgi:hypothetical protein
VAPACELPLLWPEMGAPLPISTQTRNKLGNSFMKLDFYDRSTKNKLIDDMYGLSTTYYTALKPNFTELLDSSRSQDEKADLLVRAANASDPRALRRLEALVEKVEVVSAGIPDIQDQIAHCQQSVDMTHRIQQGFIDQINRKAGEQGIT